MKAFTITHDEYRQFLIDYEERDLYPNQRLGQAFCNKYNLTDNALFYEPNNYRSSAAIFTNYVEQ